MVVSVHVTGPLMTNCYIVQDEGTGKAAVIDPAEFTVEAKEQIDRIGRDNITHIILTHCHFDHILGATELKEYTGAPIAVHQYDAEGLGDIVRNGINGFGIECARLPKADIMLSEGSEVETGDIIFKVMHTPGHTIGSICLLCGDAIFSGDTLFLESCGRTDLPTGDMYSMKKSLKRLAALEGDYRVYPGHDEPTYLSHERKHNFYMK